MESQIDSGATCNVISNSLVCKLLQDGNLKHQEIKSKLRMYDGSIMISYAVIDIKCKVNQGKPKLQSNISISKSIVKFSHPECKQ